MSNYLLSSAKEAGERPSEAKHPKVYQIDFTAVAAGKRIASTKRRVRWRFGFANPEALAAGQTGTDCRGEEHDITLVWSITSGKRLILADGQEVHYSSSRAGILDFSWTMRGNHVLKILAHSAPPLSATPGFRQYDFFVDGQSFFSFPKVFRLGLSPGDPRGNGPQPNHNDSINRVPSVGGSVRSSGLASIEAPHNPDEEEAFLQEAIRNSLIDAASKPNVSQAGKDLLLDFFDDTSTVTTAPVQIASQPYSSADYGHSYTAAAPPAFASHPPYGTPAPAVAAYNNYALSAPQESYALGSSYPTQTPHGGAGLLALPAPPPTYPAAPGPQPSDPWGSPPGPAVPQSGWVAPVPAPVPSSAWVAPAPTPVPSSAWGQGLPPTPMTPTFGTQPDSMGAQAQTPAGVYGFASPPVANPPSAVEFHNPAPLATPSSVGFASPQSNRITPHAFSEQTHFAAAPVNHQTQANQTYPSDDPASEQAPPAGDPSMFSMYSLSGQVEPSAPTHSTASLADQLYAKYANLGEFDLVSKKEPARENPFAAAPVGSTMSLAAMKTSVSKTETKRPIMNNPVSLAAQPGSLVLHGSQQGNNWGHDVQQPMYGHQAPAPPQQMPSFAQPPSIYGQQPTGYGQPSQQQAPSLHQPVFGQSHGLVPQENPFGAYGGQKQF